MGDRDFRLEVFKNASLCRNFEEVVFSKIQDKTINFPVYLSAGQEYVSSSVYTFIKSLGILPNTFIQHRGHSYYINSGAPIEGLIDELLGRKTGCSGGMGGSASIQSITHNIFGHDGLMGSQVPIAVGHCYQTRQPTIAVMGDASAEEDYVLGAMGWASTKKLPILFLVEDNNLSILTEKRVRRNWEMADVAKAFKMPGLDCDDDPLEIQKALKGVFKTPMLLNVQTTRKYWHSGAGKDGDYFDRYEREMDILGREAIEIDRISYQNIKNLWEKQLGKQ